MTTIQALILAFIEGATEFLPVSSTGHLIIVSKFFSIEDDPFVQAFNVIIQSGCILSVCVLYKDRFMKSWVVYEKLAFAFFPTALLGFLLKDFFEPLLGRVDVVAWALIIGGIILYFVDKKENLRIHQSAGVQNNLEIYDLNRKNCLWIGLAQTFALVPGVSRAAAAIIGGRTQGLSRVAATEFSFLLAVPTLGAASLYKALKIGPTIQHDQLQLLLLGFVASFIFGLLAIKLFIKVVARFGLYHFAYYRIALGLFLLLA